MPKRRKLINLLPQEEFAASTAGRVVTWLLSTFRYLVIGTEMVVIAAFLSRFYFDSRLADLNEEIRQKESYVRAYADFEQQFRSVQTKLSIFSKMSGSEHLSGINEKVTSRMPGDVSLLQLEFLDDKKIRVQGSSLTERSIEQFMVNLNDEGFSDVRLTQAESKVGSPFIIFTLETQYGSSI